jgi:hypothetical protein
MQLKIAELTLNNTPYLTHFIFQLTATYAFPGAAIF